MMIVTSGLILGSIATIGVIESLNEDENFHPIAAHYFEGLDANKDNNLTLAEFIDPVNSYGLPNPNNGAPGHIQISIKYEEEHSEHPSIKSNEDTTKCNVKMGDIAKAQYAIEFNNLDTNKNGFVSRSEFNLSRLFPSNKEMASEFNRHDPNGDGVITKTELNELVSADLSKIPTYKYGPHLIAESATPEVCRRGFGGFELTVKLMRISPKFDLKYNAGALDQIVSELDVNNDRKLNFNEFTRWYLK